MTQDPVKCALVLISVKSQVLTYSPVFHPLVFDASSEPGRGILAGAEFARVRSTIDRFSNHGALVRHGGKFDVIGRTTEEHQRPAFIIRLFLGGRPSV